MCHGQSRTPVPTILGYPNILMRTCPIGQSFFIDWIHSTKNSMDENNTNVPGRESIVIYTGPL